MAVEGECTEICPHARLEEMLSRDRAFASEVKFGVERPESEP